MGAIMECDFEFGGESRYRIPGAGAACSFMYGNPHPIRISHMSSWPHGSREIFNARVWIEPDGVVGRKSGPAIETDNGSKYWMRDGYVEACTILGTETNKPVLSESLFPGYQSS